MANKIVVEFIVAYIYAKTNEMRIKNFGTEFVAASDAYDKCKKLDYSCRLSSKIGDHEVTVAAHNWTKDEYKSLGDRQWKDNAAILLKNAGLNCAQINTVLTMTAKELKNAVFANNIEKLCELKGIAMISAQKIVTALRDVSNPNPAPLGRSKSFIRVRLNNMPDSDLLEIDTIRKTVSPFEAACLEIGGKDAVIHVVSRIDDVDEDDEGALLHRQALLNRWIDIIVNGLVINGVKYRMFGHGTNSAKWCKGMAVLESIYDAMTAWKNRKMNPEWQNTAAKDIAYKVGLHSVAHHKIDIPVQPEDFCIFKTIETNYVTNVTKEFLDGHAEDLDNEPVPVKRSDGVFMMHVSDKMRAVLFNRMVMRGDNPEEALERLHAWLNDTSFMTYRADGAALKGLGIKCFNFHERAKDLKIYKTPDGRNYDDIIFCVDETVIKTAIGEGKAYATFKDWCDDVRKDLALGTVVKTHKKAKKDVSYQVTQSICEATDEQVEAMGHGTVEKLNKLHTANGAANLLGYEWGTIMRTFPTLANVPVFKEQIEHTMMKQINTAFAGKILHSCYYAFVSPDPMFVFDAWNGLKPEPILKAGEIHLPGVKYGKNAMWRSPVMHPNSVRVVNNVAIPKQYRKYFTNDEFAIILNCIDDIPVAMDMDFDGDHANVTEKTAIIDAVETTLKKWNRLIIWETPKANKETIDEKALQKYWIGLTHMNELGLTVYGLNALLNGIKRVKDEVTGHWSLLPVPVSHRGVNFKKFAANVLVDASKHGGAEIEEPAESAQADSMEQPWAKRYQDAVRDKKLWYVKHSENGKTERSYFETKALAQNFYDNLRYEVVVDEDGIPLQDANGNVVRIDRFEEDPNLVMKIDEPANYLDELANPKYLSKNLRHKTLNKLFAYFAENVRRDVDIDDLPEDPFDYTKLMFNKEVGYRGLSGLIRRGKMALVSLGDRQIRPDQGLFDSLAQRFERDRAEWTADDSIKDKEDNTFEMTWRINALAEIKAYAEAFGKTLHDAYDVITWQMFEYCDKQYLQMNGKTDFLRDSLWRAYKVIFGGMAIEATESYRRTCVDIEDDISDTLEANNNID